MSETFSQPDNNIEQQDIHSANSPWKRRILLIVVPMVLLVGVIVSVKWYLKHLSNVEKQYVGYWHTIRDNGTNQTDVYLAFHADRQFSSATREGNFRPSTPGRPVTWRANSEKISLHLKPTLHEVLPFGPNIDHNGALNVVSVTEEELTVSPASTAETYQRVAPDNIPAEILHLLQPN